MYKRRRKEGKKRQGKIERTLQVSQTNRRMKTKKLGT
jgi:hypothetical protein